MSSLLIGFTVFLFPVLMVQVDLLLLLCFLQELSPAGHQRVLLFLVDKLFGAVGALVLKLLFYTSFPQKHKTTLGLSKLFFFFPGICPGRPGSPHGAIGARRLAVPHVQGVLLLHQSYMWGLPPYS